MGRSVTPAAITDRIRAFCKRVSPNAEPEYLTVEAESRAAIKDCFPVVDGYVEKHGGERVLGWQIWEWPGVFVEAEFHAVWKAPGGELRDLTPKPFGINRILFVPDPSRTYQGRQVNNIREALSNDSATREFIAALDAEFEFMNRGARAEQHGEIELDEDDTREHRLIQLRKLRAEMALSGGASVFVPRAGAPGRNDPCPCGSGRKFKKCHGG